MLRFATTHRLLLTLVLAGLAGVVGGLGTWASFTGSATPQAQAVSSGTMTLTIPAAGASNRLTVGATDIAPGDTIQRTFTLTPGGSVDAAAITLTTTATTSSLLDTDGTDGLQMTIDSCSVAWTEGGSAPAYTYTCGGSTSSVLASRAVIGSNLSLSNVSLTAGTDNHLRLTLTLPSSAGNSFQGLSSTVSYQFASTQRAGTSK